ncbi:MAG: cytochrome c1 [Alphaproteobacteria bacterium]|nr:cytochrome c1 [Alphaproteobacteria bacterium]
MRMKVLVIAAAFLAGISSAQASGEKIELPQIDWSWKGPFSGFDKAQLQRGLQVYTEVCATCHSLGLVAYRDLADLGYGEEEIKAYAGNYEVQDGPDDEGEMYTRPAIPSDRFVAPFPNENAARASNNGAYPPDLSLMVKARKDGTNYLYAMMIGYADEAPEDIQLMEGMNYHKYFAGHQIAMPQPLSDGVVEYTDGTEATLDQQAKDVTAFLAWAAEPELEERKSLGIKVLLFLFVLFVMAVAVKKAVWRDIKH